MALKILNRKLEMIKCVLAWEDALLAMKTCRQTLVQLLLQVHPQAGATCLGRCAKLCLRCLHSGEASCYHQDHILYPGLRDR